MRKSKLLSFIFLLLAVHASGQLSTSNAFTINVLPPAPEVAAYNKYVSLPVSYYTGTPAIEIPLYTIRERGGLTWPIGLSYHSGGFKVAEDAPRTGLGWTLTGVGMISRTVRGAADEYYPDSYLTFMKGKQDNDFFYHSTDAPSVKQNKLQLYKKLINGCEDTEPDLFTIILPGFSAKFYFTPDGEIQVDADRKVKITPIGLNPGNLQYIKSWLVTTDDGNKYFFQEPSSSNKERDPGVPLCALYGENNVVTSWHLVRMESFNGQSWIDFKYTHYSQYQEILGMEQRIHNVQNGGLINARTGITRVIYSDVQLDTIITSSKTLKINFQHGALRKDIDVSSTVPTTPDCFTLGKIEIMNEADETIRNFRFEYDYSTGRLTLKKLTESGKLTSLPPYVFTYNNIVLPNVKSYAQDSWGFLNNNKAQTLIPSVSYEVPPATLTFDELGNWKNIYINWENTEFNNDIPVTGYVNIAGADRSSSTTGALAGLLKMIVWPTGRKTTFDFESHQYGYEQNTEIKEHIYLRDESVFMPALFTSSPPKPLVKEILFTIPENAFPSNKPKKIVNLSRFVTIQKGLTFSIYRPKLTLYKGNTVLRIWNSSESPGSYTYIENIELEKGNYKLKSEVYFPGDIDHDGIALSNSMQMKILWKLFSADLRNVTKIGGGARIRSIAESDGLNKANDFIRRFDYTVLKNGKNISSGVAAFYKFTYAHIFQPRLEFTSGSPSQKYELIRYSINRTSLDPTHGSHVGYSQVTELIGKNGEGGKTEYTFTTEIGNPDIILLKTVPFPPAKSNEYRRGQLLTKADYKYRGSFAGIALYGLVAKQVNKYGFVTETSVNGYRVGAAFNLSEVSIPGDNLLNAVKVVKYPNVRGYSRLLEKRDSLYFSNGTSYGTLFSYQYDETQKLLTHTKIKNSQEKTITTQTKYPLSYQPASDVAIEALINKHRLNLPIEEITYEEKGNSQVKLLSAVKNQYKIKNTQQVVLFKKFFTQPASGKITASPFLAAGNLYEERALFSAYDAYDNILQQAKSKDIPTSYIWGYGNRFPVAEVKNAKSGQIYFEGFEYVQELPVVLSTSSKTGRKCLNSGSFTIPFIPLNDGATYLMSYWYFEGDQWKLAEDIPFSRTINRGTRLDDVRVYPRGALFTSYTYDPELGITSVTDANNLAAYFFYDDLGRLIEQRDHKGNITKSVRYQLHRILAGGRTINSIQVTDTKKENITSATGIATLPKSNVSQTTTYIDGFGRNVQAVVKSGSPLGKDIVQVFAYDSLNRQPLQYLPYVASTSTGAYRDIDPKNPNNPLFGFYKSPSFGVASNLYPFSEAKFDNSPLNRIEKKGAPGADWGVNAHPVVQNYSANTDADEVLLLTVENGGILKNGFYQKGVLYVEETIDENNNRLRIFTDKQKRKILQRQQLSENEWLDTYSVYAANGELLYVLPPKAVKVLPAR